MEKKATFQTLIHDESFISKFHDIPRRVVKIQVWRNLVEYKPAIPMTY